MSNNENNGWPSWCVPGARVVMYSSHPFSVRLGTIKRVMKRDVVTEDGSRLQLDPITGRVVAYTGSGNWRRISETVVPVGSPEGQYRIALHKGKVARRKMAELIASNDSDAAVVEQLTAYLSALSSAAHDQLILQDRNEKER